MQPVIVKPAGIPTNGSMWRTAENALPFNLKKSTLADALTYVTLASCDSYCACNFLIICSKNVIALPAGFAMDVNIVFCL